MNKMNNFKFPGDIEDTESTEDTEDTKDQVLTLGFVIFCIIFVLTCFVSCLNTYQ